MSTKKTRSGLVFGKDGRLDLTPFSQPLSVSQMFSFSRYGGTPVKHDPDGSDHESVDPPDGSDGGESMAPTETTAMAEKQEINEGQLDNDEFSTNPDPFGLFVGQSMHDVSSNKSDRENFIVVKMLDVSEHFLRKIPGIDKAEANSWIKPPKTTGGSQVISDTRKAELTKRMKKLLEYKSELEELAKHDNSVNDIIKFVDIMSKDKNGKTKSKMSAVSTLNGIYNKK